MEALRIATYNLLHGLDLSAGTVDLAACAAAIAALEAELVALQEVDRHLARSGGSDQVADLAARLGWHGVFAPALLGDPDVRWRAVAPEDLAEGDASGPAYGIGLVSALPLRAVQRVRLPGGGDGTRRGTTPPLYPGWDREPRVALQATVEVAGVPVAVTATHLSYLPWRGLAQLRAAARMAGAGNGPAVLLGDLNLPVWLVRAALPGWRHACGEPTYPVWRPRLQPDQALVRGALTAVARAGPPGPSDHLPLVVDLSFP